MAHSETSRLTALLPTKFTLTDFTICLCLSWQQVYMNFDVLHLFDRREKAGQRGSTT
jgi:hypothetical protein